MTFKKLVLVSAMFAATSGAYAMEAMDEEALAAATGQDGITISLSTSASLDVIIHDKDGFAGNTDSGALYLDNVGIAGAGGTGKASVDIVVDAGAANATASGTLNIGITLGAAQLNLGSLRVANSNRAGTGVTATGWSVVTNSGEQTALMNLGTVDLASGTTLNIQLGNEPQLHMIVMNANLTSGVTLNNFALNDVGTTAATSGGSIGVGQLIVNNAGAATNLNTNIFVDVDETAGLIMTLDQLGVAGTGAGSGIDVTMAQVSLGSASSVIGDVEIIGLNMNGDTISVRGH